MYVNKLILNNLMYLFSLIFILNAFLSIVINFSSYSCMAVPSNRVLRTIGTVRVSIYYMYGTHSVHVLYILPDIPDYR